MPVAQGSKVMRRAIPRFTNVVNSRLELAHVAVVLKPTFVTFAFATSKQTRVRQMQLINIQAFTFENVDKCVGQGH